MRCAHTVLRVLWDIALWVLGTTFAMLAVTGVPGATSGPLVITDIGVVIALLAALLWTTVLLRRRFPLVVIAAGTVITLAGMDYWLVLIGVFHALIRWERRPALAAGITGAAVVCIAAVRDALRAPDSTAMGWLLGITSTPDSIEVRVGIAIVVVVIALISAGATAGLALLVRSRREAVVGRTRIAAAHRENADLADELARQSERDRLAHEIHDALAHRLSVISLQSGALETATHSSDPALAHAARVLRGQAHASLEDLRGLLGDLRTGGSRAQVAAAPPSTASLRALPRLVRSLREGGTTVDAVILLDRTESAPPVLDRSVYRIVQESLTNALKHAPGAPVSLYVDGAPGTGIRIRVTNPLPHTPGTPLGRTGTGSGIAGIRERIRILGGTSWIGESEGVFVVDATLPWPEDAGPTGPAR
ncbi:sensor histidine kinase [Brevibacterium ihuae]|uniref:sensor histidine kinase n=1 Tax=Brevibacterium ihuae TaxID=1631743 RepID=UPI0015E0725B|nr:histidine kinase [Brevibacterium ihuae]